MLFGNVIGIPLMGLAIFIYNFKQLSIGEQPHFHEENAYGRDFFRQRRDEIGLFGVIRLFFPRAGFDNAGLGRIAGRFEAAVNAALAHDVLRLSLRHADAGRTVYPTPPPSAV